MKQNSKAADVTAVMIGALLTAWLAVLTAPYVQQGLIGIIKNLGTAMSDPFKLTWCENSLKTILAFLLVYSLVIAMVFTNRKNYRRGEEQGSARWGEITAINKKYAQNPAANNRLLTQHVRMGLDDHKHMRNLNVMVVGGSGAGKTRYYCLPNLLQCPECSFVILDPKGEILRATGNLLIQKGYTLKVLDLISMERSHCYNPLMYVRNDEEAQKLVTNLFKSTTPKDSKSSDPFWENMAQNLLMALVFLLLYEAPEEEQNFAMVMDLLRAGAIEDEEHPVPTALDRIFAELRTRKPDHMAVKFYDSYHVGAAKTLASIQVTLASHLDKFNLDSMAKLTITDEMELNTLGERKTALFAIIPDSDTSFNFLISMLYTQLFQKLKDQADFVHGGRLPIPVHFLMDEFANVALPSEFEKDLAAGSLTGEYFVRAKMNGVETYTCPQTDMNTLVTETRQKVAINVWPNPTSESVNVNISNENPTHILRILNTVGLEMEHRTFDGENTRVDMSDYPRGSYMLSIDGIVVRVIRN